MTKFAKAGILSLALMLNVSFLNGCSMATETSWKTHNISLGEAIFQIDLPRNESSNFVPTKPVVDSVNLRDTSLFENNKDVTVITKFWDFHKGVFNHVEGALKVTISIRKIPSKLKDNIFDLNKLRDLTFSIIAEENITLPSTSNRKIINGVEWLSFNLDRSVKNKAQIEFYLTPIDQSHYIQVQSFYIDNTSENVHDWRKRAKNTFSSMISSMILRRNN